jgi:hypothetical protein
MLYLSKYMTYNLKVISIFYIILYLLWWFCGEKQRSPQFLWGTLKA